MRTLLLSLLFCTVCTAASAQTPEEAVETLNRDYPQEKVVMLLSKPQYVAGETIFFKAYTLDGYRLAALSTNLYTELYDGKKNLLQKRIVPLFGGSGQGSFPLPSSLAEDVYYIRAYTTQMLNYDPAFEFAKPVLVYNAASAKRLQPKPAAWSAVVAAEGGTVLAGKFTRLAVRLLSTTALPASWQADLYEKGGSQSLSPVEVYNSEIGAVNFMPEAGKSYVVRIKDAAGTVQEVEVPAPKAEGSSLAVAVADNRIAYQIATQNLASNGAGYKLLVNSNQQAVFSATIKNSSGEVTGVIDAKSLPAGVLRFTLFNEKGEAVNERLCFRYPKLDEPTVTTDTLSFAKKGYNVWRLATDSTAGNYAVRVLDGDLPDESGFLPQLYLTGDFSSTIHKANEYLTATTAEQKTALQTLLITESWKRFQWSEAMQRQHPPLRFKPETYLDYTATVNKAGKPQPLRDLTLILKPQNDSSTQFLEVTTDSAGRFSISDAVFADTVRVFYRASQRKFLEKEVSIDFALQNNFQPIRNALPPAAFETVPRLPADTVPASVKRAAAQRAAEKVLLEKSELLKEIVISTQAKNATKNLEKSYSSGLFSQSGVSSTTFDFVNDPQNAALGYSNILQWLRGRVSGLVVNNIGGRIEVQIRGSRSLLGNSSAQIYVDDMPVDGNYLNGFPVASIALIKVVKGPSLAGANGAIAIYTKRGGEGGAITVGLPSTFIVGYQTPPRFFQPDYSVSTFANVPDGRTVLQYADNLFEGAEEGRYPIRFYNNDSAKKYRLVVAGFDAEGKPVYANKIVEGKSF